MKMTSPTKTLPSNTSIKSSCANIEEKYGASNNGPLITPLVLLLALIDPSTTGFELLQLNIHNPKATARDIIEPQSIGNCNKRHSMIRKAAKDSRLAKLKYHTICDYHGNIVQKNTPLVNLVGCTTDSNENSHEEEKKDDHFFDDRYHYRLPSSSSPSSVWSSSFRDIGEILIAVPIGYTPLDCTALVRNIVSHYKVINTLERLGIDTSTLLTLDSYSDNDDVGEEEHKTDIDKETKKNDMSSDWVVTSDLSFHPSLSVLSYQHQCIGSEAMIASSSLKPSFATHRQIKMEPSPTCTMKAKMKSETKKKKKKKRKQKKRKTKKTTRTQGFIDSATGTEFQRIGNVWRFEI